MGESQRNEQQAAELKRVLEVGASFATLIGFALPQPLGIVITLGAGITRTLIAVFFPGRAPSEIETLVSTAKDIVDAVQRMGVHLEKTVWQGVRDEHLADVAVIADVQASLMTSLVQGAWTAEDLPENVQDDWERQFDGVFRECGAESRLRLLLAWIELDQNKRFIHQLTPLYLTASTLYLNVCKLGLIIEGVRIERGRKQRHEEWALRHPDGVGTEHDPEPTETRVDDGALARMATWADLTRQLKVAVTRGQELIDEVADAYAQASRAISKRESQFKLKRVEGPTVELVRRLLGSDEPWCFEDEGTRFNSEPMATRDEAELAMLIARGRAVTAAEEEQRRLHSLDGIDQELIDEMRGLMTVLRDACPDYGIDPDKLRPKA